MSKSKGHLQLELKLERPLESDRNAALKGRSFYFFDLDDNVLCLLTPIVLFHKKTNEELTISSHELASEGGNVGKIGPFADYVFNYDDNIGSFRFFRDLNLSWFDKLFGKKQFFVQDLISAMNRTDWNWKGPSWDYFYHAVYNQRPISIITARGHHPETIKDGIKILVEDGHIARNPNYLCVYPVSNPEIKLELTGGQENISTAELKKFAIFRSVEMAIQKYGNYDHRFGMSDDDPKNLKWITDAMIELKAKYDHMGFFVIDTHNGQCIKKEVFVDRIEDSPFKEKSNEGKEDQIKLFDL